MPIKVVIVEDEEIALARMNALLAQYHDIEIIGLARNGDAAVHEIDTKAPDVVFLDIQLPGKNGFDVLKAIHHHPFVVFVTAFDKYSLEAFEENSIDYVLKPITESRIAKAIEKIRLILHHSTKSLYEAVDRITLYQKHSAFFSVKDGQDIRIIPESDICYFSADEKYVFLHTYDATYYYNSTLKDLDLTLQGQEFCRIHKSCIVAIAKIHSIKKIFPTGLFVIVADKQLTRIRVSRSYLKEFKERIRLTFI